jgi:phage minor structural protein
MPATVKAVQTLPPIRIYEADEKTFATNGLRCLTPQTAEVTLKDQQAHSLHMVHPLDDGGAWHTIQLSRILYVPIIKRGVMTFQPMRIYKIQKQRQSGGALSITVDAKHVFYDLNSVMVQACTISSLACQAAIDAVFNAVFRPTETAQASDAFTYSSDIVATASAEYTFKTVTAALIGDDASIASLYGGELFVDGFRFSINSRMEGAQDNAFNLAYGYNLTGITATYSTESTYSTVVGQSGTQTLVRTVDPAPLELPFDRTIYAKFSYQSGTPASRFAEDMDRYSDDNAKVSASYQVTFADLPQTEEYKGFANLASHEVGDTGTVYDADLDVNTIQRIVEKRMDVITQTAVSATLGSIPASITQQRAYANTVTNELTAEDKANTVLAQEIADAFAAIAAMNLPKKTASGAPPLTVTAALAQSVETWAVYGASGGVGTSVGIVISVNGSEAAAVSIPQKLYSGDYIRRSEGGAAVLHLEHDSNGAPATPTDQTITMPVIIIAKGTNTVTVAGSTQPENVEIVYR